jgi:hypothetical protein
MHAAAIVELDPGGFRALRSHPGTLPEGGGIGARVRAIVYANKFR